MGRQLIDGGRKNDLESVFLSSAGRRILKTMLLIQPISRVEMKSILSLSLAVFEPGKKIDRVFPEISHARSIPEVVESFRITQYFLGENKPIENNLFNEVFRDSDLYGEDSIIQKAERCGLIIGIPKKKGQKEKYYFLNSDLEFTIKPGELQVTEDASSFRMKCPFDDYSCDLWLGLKRVTKRGVKIKKETINIPMTQENNRNLFYLLNSPILLPNSLLNTIAWTIKYPEKMKTLWAFCSKNKGKVTRRELGWRVETIRKAIEDLVIYRYQTGDSETLKMVSYILFNSPFRLASSYRVLQCFREFEDFDVISHQSPMKILRQITKKKYKLEPSKRSLAFTSLVARIPPNITNQDLQEIIASVDMMDMILDNIRKKNLSDNDYKKLLEITNYYLTPTIKKISQDRLLVERNSQLVGYIFQEFFKFYSMQSKFLNRLYFGNGKYAKWFRP